MEVSSRLVVCNCVLLDFDRKWSWVLFQYECRKSAKIASSINLQFYSYGSLSKWKKITSLTGFEPIKKELKFNECVCVCLVFATMEPWPVFAHFLVTSLGTNLVVQFIQIRYKMTLNYPMIKLLKNCPLPILYAYGLANSTRQKGSF